MCHISCENEQTNGWDGVELHTETERLTPSRIFDHVKLSQIVLTFVMIAVCVCVCVRVTVCVGVTTSNNK